MRCAGGNTFDDRFTRRSFAPTSTAVIECSTSACGTGALLRELTRASVRAIGADVSIGMLASARFCGASLAAGDAELLPFRSETFDSDHIQLILISGRTGNAAWRRSEESCAAAVNWSSPTGATTSSPAASATHTCECAAPHINES
ncbi:MAG: hypothetical protein DMF58_16730 [Acidobacteria bacterium]|nr:MAG: hypothetical protein DMF58_16730 [Acidobacteriota bacterium]